MVNKNAASKSHSKAKVKIYKDLKPGTFDLHIHTTASDGVFTPSEILKKAKNLNLSTIAITDHDSVEGIPESIVEGKDLDIEVIPGVEISSSSPEP